MEGEPILLNVQGGEPTRGTLLYRNGQGLLEVAGKLVLELRGSCCFLLSVKSEFVLPGSELLGLGLR